MITQARLKELFTYNPETGIFTRKAQRGSQKAGSKAGCLNRSNGYVAIMVDYRSRHAHRLAWIYMTGETPKNIDHINGNRSDNRFENLRNVETQQNNTNASLQKRNKTGFVGVREVPSGRFQSICYVQPDRNPEYDGNGCRQPQLCLLGYNEHWRNQERR